MKRIYSFLFLVSSLICVFFVLHLHRSATVVIPRLKEHPKEKSSIGTKEDPDARWKYELMRYRDPKTGVIPPSIRQREMEFASTLPRDRDLALSKSTGTYQTLTFTRRGPWNVGGRTRALTFDIANESIMLAGGVSGGMWRSTNGGTSWTKTTGMDQLHSVTCVVQDTRLNKRNNWYYGTGEYIGNSASGGASYYSGDGIFKSTDDGLSWVSLPSTSTKTPQWFDTNFDYIYTLVTNPAASTNDEVYAATAGAIMRSTDGGASWTRVLGGLTNASPRFTDLGVTSNGVFYTTLSTTPLSGTGTSTGSGIYRSTDGTTWTPIAPATWPATYDRVVIGIAPSNPNVVYFLGKTPGSGSHGANSNDWISLWKYTYVSGDGSGSGGAWTDLSANLPTYGGNVGDLNSQGSYNLVIRVKPDNENAVFLGLTNIYRSTDGFTTKTKINWIGGYSPLNDVSQYENHHPDQHALVFSISNPYVLYSGHDGGVSKTTNCLATSNPNKPVYWTSLNNGYHTTQFYTIAVDQSTTANQNVIGGLQDNGTWIGNSTLGTAPWLSAFSGDGAYCAFVPATNSIYVSAQNSLVYRGIVDANFVMTNYTRVDPVRPTGAASYLFINPFVLDPNNQSTMYLVGGDRIWRNDNLTAIPLGSQNPTSSGWNELTTTAISGQTITALSVSKFTVNRLYYGVSLNKVYKLDNANVNSSVPVDITGASFPAGGYVSCIAVDPADGNNILAIFSNYGVKSIWHSSNAGTSWEDVSGNLEQNPDGTGNGPSVRWAEIIHPAQGGTAIFVGTSTGLYATARLNSTSTLWIQQGASIIGNVVVDVIASRAADGFLAVGTHGGGVFTTFVTDTMALSVAQPELQVFSYRLAQNYPNPFNPSTTISYNIGESERVILRVFDISGRAVATLVNEQQSAGTHTIHFDGTRLASGTYVYTLQAGKYRESRKMTLVR
jgi:hypothetical protein